MSLLIAYHMDLVGMGPLGNEKERKKEEEKATGPFLLKTHTQKHSTSAAFDWPMDVCFRSLKFLKIFFGKPLKNRQCIRLASSVGRAWDF